MNSYIDRAEEVLMYTYNRYPIVWERGEGVYLYDINKKKYLDFASGIAVFALGYQNKDYNDALKAQIDNIIHVSNYYYSVPMIEAAEKLVKASKMDKVFFTNSGTEAIEGAIKLAKKYYYNKTGLAEGEIIAMEHSFHGRSTGALAITGTPKYREAFGPLIPGISFAKFNDLESVKEKLTEKTCAIILEPIQGEGGIYPATNEFIKGVRELCTQQDICFILDEIQCGMGRTGNMFAYQGYKVEPDIITCAKALGCGVPIGAFCAKENIAKAFVPGDHGTTYGGNPFATAAVSKVFDLFEQQKILEHVNQVSVYLEEQLELLKQKYSFILERRGKGLMQGLQFSKPVGEIIKRAQKEGLILISAGTDVIRFLPPLIIEKEHVNEMIAIVEKCLILL